MKKYILTTVLVLFAFCAHAAETRVGYVDLNRALNESDAGKDAVVKLEEMVKSKQGIIEYEGEKIKKIEEELTKQASVLTPDAAKEKKEEREKLLRNYQRMVKDSQEEVQKKQAEFMDEIVRKLRIILQETGKEEGYTIILEKAESGVLYFSPEIDMTDALIKKFNEVSKNN